MQRSKILCLAVGSAAALMGLYALRVVYLYKNVGLNVKLENAIPDRVLDLDGTSVPIYEGWEPVVLGSTVSLKSTRHPGSVIRLSCSRRPEGLTEASFVEMSRAVVGDAPDRARVRETNWGHLRVFRGWDLFDGWSFSGFGRGTVLTGKSIVSIDFFVPGTDSAGGAAVAEAWAMSAWIDPPDGWLEHIRSRRTRAACMGAPGLLQVVAVKAGG